ncbi:MAG: M20/M25/M40 family metallo-hydrolase [Solirubrobacterales bacterium]
MDVFARMEVIDELCSFEGRRAGTDAERRAANRLAERLRDTGRRTDVEPTYVHPQYGLVHGVHCALGFAGSLVAILQPAVGFGMVLAAAVSMYLDLNGRFYLARRLFFRRASQNVVARGRNPDAPARVFITAHYDSARSGSAFDPRRVARASRVSRRLGLPIAPFRVLFWSLAVLLPILGARMAGLDSNLVSLLQLIPTLALLVGAFMLTDIELSNVVPGANDNASGVATALSLAEELDANAPDNLDVWVLLTGAEECQMEGMRSFIRSHRKSIDRDSTYFIVLDAVGAGTVRYETGEGLAVTYDLDRRLAELCAAVADADRENGNRFNARPWRSGFATDALPPRIAKLRATAITCLADGSILPAHYHRPDDVPRRIDRKALDRAHDFVLELVRALDRDVGRRASQ